MAPKDITQEIQTVRDGAVSLVGKVTKTKDEFDRVWDELREPIEGLTRNRYKNSAEVSNRIGDLVRKVEESKQSFQVAVRSSCSVFRTQSSIFGRCLKKSSNTTPEQAIKWIEKVIKCIKDLHSALDGMVQEVDRIQMVLHECSAKQAEIATLRRNEGKASSVAHVDNDLRNFAMVLVGLGVIVTVGGVIAPAFAAKATATAAAKTTATVAAKSAAAKGTFYCTTANAAKAVGITMVTTGGAGLVVSERNKTPTVKLDGQVKEMNKLLSALKSGIERLDKMCEKIKHDIDIAKSKASEVEAYTELDDVDDLAEIVEELKDICDQYVQGYDQKFKE